MEEIFSASINATSTKSIGHPQLILNQFDWSTMSEVPWVSFKNGKFSNARAKSHQKILFQTLS